MTQHQIEMTRYLSSFIEELVQAGVKDAVISPGSRSTPLAMLMAEHPTLKIYVDIDERSAGFSHWDWLKRHTVPLYCFAHQAQQQLTICQQ